MKVTKHPSHPRIKAATRAAVEAHFSARRALREVRERIRERAVVIGALQ